MFSKRDIHKDLSEVFFKKIGEVSLLLFIKERCLAKKKLHNSALRLKSTKVILREKGPNTWYFFIQERLKD